MSVRVPALAGPETNPTSLVRETPAREQSQWAGEGGGSLCMKKHLWQIVIFAILIATWSVLFALRAFNELLLPSPLTVFGEATRLFGEKRFWFDFAATAYRALAGFLLGCGVGMIFGFVFSAHKKVGAALHPWIDFLRSIPGPALIPIFMLFLGLGESAKVAFVAFIVSLIVVVGVIAGVNSVNATRRLFMQCLRMSKTQMFFKHTLPEAAPHISAAVKIGLSFSLIATVVAEMIMSADFGLGKRIIEFQMVYETGRMYATIVMIGVFGYLVNQVYLQFEKRYVHWSGK